MPDINNFLCKKFNVPISNRAWVIAAGLCLMFVQPLVFAQKTILIGVIETMGYPLNQFDKRNQLSGGLLKDLGDVIAMELGATPSYLPLPRKRIDQWLESGNIDVVCYTNPKWTDKPEIFHWSMTILPQIERVVSRYGTDVPIETNDFLGKRISLQLGFHYDTIQPLFDSGKAIRIDETNVHLMFKAVEAGAADALISSEGEIDGYFKDQPDKRKLFEVAKSVFSREDTSCAISKKSSWSKSEIDKAIAKVEKRGEFARMAKRYGMLTR